MSPDCCGKAMVREPDVVMAETAEGVLIDSNVFQCLRCGRRMANVKRYYYPSPSAQRESAAPA